MSVDSLRLLPNAQRAALLDGLAGADVVAFHIQADAGIRDGTVTGVQTCALPISARRVAPQTWPSLWPHGAPRLETPPCSERPVPYRLWLGLARELRSEERRVGKGRRCRWTRCDCCRTRSAPRCSTGSPAPTWSLSIFKPTPAYEMEL